MKIPKGITKNVLPPHAEIANAKEIPLKIIRKNLKFDFSLLIPLKNKYVARKPKNNPRGSDLNQPKEPRKIIGSEIENKREDSNAVVFPENVLTKRKIKNVEDEPITTGKIIVKS